MVLICLGAASWLSPLDTWERTGPLLLFLVLLTLLNAPFVWGSLGLTRSLLRRGLELEGWWPYALALVDAALAALIIAALALAMVVGVQAFDALAVHGGGSPVLPLDPLFNGIAAHPSAPEYWWLYALLLSTMIPSLVNLVIGGASLARGVPGLPSLLLRFMPERGGVLKWDRTWIAAVLTSQVAIGTALGIAAQAFLAIGIIGYVIPGSATVCSTWPATLPASTCRRGWGSSSGSACNRRSTARPSHPHTLAALLALSFASRLLARIVLLAVTVGFTGGANLDGSVHF
jgi:hypothetical protein